MRNLNPNMESVRSSPSTPAQPRGVLLVISSSQLQLRTSTQPLGDSVSKSFQAFPEDQGPP